jgi:hypothetical protein
LPSEPGSARFPQFRRPPKELQLPPESQHDQVTVVALECVECGVRDARAKGWQAYLSPETGLLVYCAECAEREFGD